MQKISYNKEIKLLMEKQKIKIVRKNDEYSAEYQVGDVFQVDLSLIHISEPTRRS